MSAATASGLAGPSARDATNILFFTRSNGLVVVVDTRPVTMAVPKCTGRPSGAPVAVMTRRLTSSYVAHWLAVSAAARAFVCCGFVCVFRGCWLCVCVVGGSGGGGGARRRAQ